MRSIVPGSIRNCRRRTKMVREIVVCRRVATFCRVSIPPAFLRASREENEGAPLLAPFEKGALPTADATCSRFLTTEPCPSSPRRPATTASLFPMWTKPKRYYGAGHLHFITCSCFRRQPRLGTARRRDLFLTVLEQVRRRRVAPISFGSVAPGS